MNWHAQMTRRGLGRMLGLAGLLPASRALGAPGLDWDAQPDPGCAFTRTYRADAQIVVLSVPVLRRAGVGGGRASWSENASVRLLDFMGYSLPDRAAGLNRLGFIRELARTEPGAAESMYFGVMTASPEESAAEARQALHRQTREQLYTAIEGRMGPGEAVTATAHFSAPAQLSVAQRQELLTMARQALSAAPRKAPQFDAAGGARPTFLQALATMLQDPSRKEIRYVYNARLYRLWLGRSPDSEAAAYFVKKNLIAAGTGVTRSEGKLRAEDGGREITFQIWAANTGQPLPLRIEYQPKPYLRLAFEAECAPAAAGAVSTP